MLSAPRGTFDILPDEQKYWQYLEKTFEKIAFSFGFLKIETPIFEYRDVFEKGVGATTDIIEKQMYLLKRLGEDEEKEAEQVLRPEMTAAMVRAYIEHGMQTWPQPVKLSATGPVFRYERPQKGRFRQHHQFDLEMFGTTSSFSDAFLLGVVRTIYQELGLSDVIFELNSIGCRNCRGKMKKVLIEYYRPYQNLICPVCQNRFLKNPLRLLDCKEEKCQRIIANAPALIDYLCADCKEHFKSLLEYLEDLEIPYDFNPRLVRGLDYYTRTIFEVIPADRGPSLGGGGRYDYLIELFGGKPTGAVGFAGGFERTVDEMKKQKVQLPSCFVPEVFLVQLGEFAQRKSLSLLFKLYKEGFKVNIALDKESLRSQLKAADKLKIPFALIVGQKEARDGTVIVKNMLDGSQETIEVKKVSEFLKKRIGGAVKVKKHK
jgi:histidyl-tRNA synthetase